MSNFLRHPFIELTREQDPSKNFESQVQTLSDHFSYYRNAQTDGNCMYSSAASLLLDYYCSPFTEVKEFEDFYKRIRFQEFEINDEIIPDYMVVSKTLFLLIQLKRESNSAIGKVESVLAHGDFMKSFIKVLRNIALHSLLHYKPEGIYWEGCEEELIESMADGRLSGEADFMGLCSGLDVNFVQVTMGRNEYKERVSTFKSARNEKEGKLVISVALITGHFYALYPKGIETLENVDAESKRQFRDAFTRIPAI